MPSFQRLRLLILPIYDSTRGRALGCLNGFKSPQQFSKVTGAQKLSLWQRGTATENHSLILI